VEHLFSNQARVALRLSHFLSNFLQNVDLYEEYGNLRGDRLLNIEQVFGEVCVFVFDICDFDSPPFAPLCENMMSSTKLDVHNVVMYCSVVATIDLFSLRKLVP